MRKRRHWHHDAPPWWRDEDEEAQDGSPVPPWIRHRWHAEHSVGAFLMGESGGRYGVGFRWQSTHLPMRMSITRFCTSKVWTGP